MEKDTKTHRKTSTTDTIKIKSRITRPGRSVTQSARLKKHICFKKVFFINPHKKSIFSQDVSQKLKEHLEKKHLHTIFNISDHTIMFKAYSSNNDSECAIIVKTDNNSKTRTSFKISTVVDFLKQLDKKVLDFITDLDLSMPDIIYDSSNKISSHISIYLPNLKRLYLGSIKGQLWIENFNQLKTLDCDDILEDSSLIVHNLPKLASFKCKNIKKNSSLKLKNLIELNMFICENIEEKIKLKLINLTKLSYFQCKDIFGEISFCNLAIKKFVCSNIKKNSYIEFSNMQEFGELYCSNIEEGVSIELSNLRKLKKVLCRNLENNVTLKSIDSTKLLTFECKNILGKVSFINFFIEIFRYINHNKGSILNLSKSCEIKSIIQN